MLVVVGGESCYLFSNHVPPIVGFLDLHSAIASEAGKSSKIIRSILLITGQIIVFEISLRLVRRQKTRHTGTDMNDFDMMLL